MNGKMMRLAAACAAGCLVLPNAAMAGTRASAAPVPVASSGKGNPAPGPKDGFPPSPGLEIAKIKANGNAAFKRKSAGT